MEEKEEVARWMEGDEGDEVEEGEGVLVREASPMPCFVIHARLRPSLHSH